MRVLMLYRRGQEGEGKAQDYAFEYGKLHPDNKIELMDVDSPEGQQKAQLYDIVSYPAVLALGDDGGLLQAWQGEQLPLMRELDYYTHS